MSFLYWLRHLFISELASGSFKSAALSTNTMHSTMSLPQEILDLIIDYVALLPPRYKTLEACALTCRAFHPRTLVCRFRHFNIAGKACDDIVKYTRLSHAAQSLITSVSITFPIASSSWLHIEPQVILPALLHALPNVRLLHIQNAEWDTMLSPQLRAALAVHSYVSVRLTQVRFKAASQLSELLRNSLHLQRLALSDTLIGMPPGRCPRSDIEVDCLEINHQDALDPITLESSRFACCHIGMSTNFKPCLVLPL
ncbi:hypothetical protein BDZ89DRAFT_1071727 [Hymenopellis radicata]|nr:hypothetical protein BDZ89DRAFT_1071727 [Hymenopellis radicata]